MTRPIEKLSEAQWDGVATLASDQAHEDLYELIAEEAAEAVVENDADERPVELVEEEAA